MGLLDKVKGILFDEEEIEIPEIKEETKKEIKINKIKEEENPIKEIKIPKDDFSDREYKSESTFTFPIDFEDDEIEPVKKENAKPKVVRETKPVNKRPEKRDYSDFLTRKEEKKHFKPTPIISPVYGVLDQNYKKEDVIVKKDILRKPNELTIEEVRKRAFGSLEDEIDANLTNTKEIKVSEEIKLKKEKVIEPIKENIIVEEPVDKKKTIGELIEEDNKNLDIPDVSGIEDEEVEYNKDVHNDKLNIPTNSIDDLLNRDTEEISKEDEIDDEEADLFSLIDSMYEEKGE